MEQEQENKIEELCGFDFYNTITDSNLYGESKWYPEATKENIKILVDKINELIEVINKK